MLDALATAIEEIPGTLAYQQAMETAARRFEQYRIDNVIKPWVLQDRSSMHPLAALIGVFGGVQAMGPLGVFVGPMVIAFLQTLLGLLHRELLQSSRKRAARSRQQATRQPAGSAAAARSTSTGLSE